ncbi:Bacterial regulatory helix-turn-helix protein, AraC family [compost metagenome]
MNLDFYQPKNEILKKYIEGYYFISKDKNSGSIQYLTFPNNFCILTTNEDIDVEIQNNEVIIQSSPAKNIMTCVVSRYKKPIKIHYKELINEVTIYFKPLGISQFLSDPKSIFSESTLLDFTFMPDFNDKMIEIFGFSRDRQILELEDYLLSKLQVKDFSLIEKILTAIENDEKIEEIAFKYQISRQYLNKIFTKHIGKSPSEYRKIHRFRNSILKQKESKNFSELSQYDFYDQSHFIRNFKELTNRNPQIFFKHINTKKENIWLFI